MQNQNMQPWAWGQAGAAPYPGGPLFQPPFSPASVDQNQLMSGYQMMYGGAPQQPPDYGASQWSAAQLQHWQQWQQWQEKFQQWQAQYGKKFEESMAAMGQNPNVVLPGAPTQMPGIMKPNEGIPNPGYTTANPPPPPSNAQPVPPPPPDDKPPSGPGKEKNNKISGPETPKEGPEELSEAEKTFDIQFKQWEDQFNEWKKQNQDHPDKVQYREYEKKWETWREQLLQRREQMRKKRLSKTNEIPHDSSSAAKSDDGKIVAQEVQYGEAESNYKTGEMHNTTQQMPLNMDSKYETKPTSSYVGQDTPGVFPHQKPGQEMNLPNPPMNSSGNFGNYTGFSDSQGTGRNQIYMERENPGSVYGPGAFDSASGKRFRSPPKDNNREKEFSAGGPRFMNSENASRGEFSQRRPFGNYDEERNERNFGPRFMNFENRGPNDFGPDRFMDMRVKDQKFSAAGRGFEQGPGAPLNEQGFNQTSRCFQDRNFANDGQNTAKTGFNSSFNKPKVPSLFDITVQKPPGLMSPGKDRKPKSFEEKNDEINLQRNDKPWLSNAWAKNNSPWIKPWELDRVMAQKPPDASLRSDAWQKESLSGVRTDDKPWTSDITKPDIDKSELSGYVGNILAKLGNFNVLPSNMPAKEPSFLTESNHQNTQKIGEGLDSKFPNFMHAQNRQGREFPLPRDSKPDQPTGFNPNLLNKDSMPNPNNFAMNQGNFGRDRFEEQPNILPQSDVRNPFMSRDNRSTDLMLFGKGDCDERIRFDRERPNFGRDNRGSFGRDGRHFERNEERNSFRRDERERPFQDDSGPISDRNVPGIDEGRLALKGDRNSFARDDRTGSKFNSLDDIDERIGRSRDRNGRRGFDDRDDRVFRLGYDRDDRRGRSFGNSFDRFGRNQNPNIKEQEWNPQVFEYSKGGQQGFRGRYSDAEENFHISTVVDYSHGENKQTFDYAHGDAKNENLAMKSFDYGHGRESPSVIDYGHGGNRDSSNFQQWKKDNDGRNDDQDSRSKSKSPLGQSRSPRGRPRSRSRSPHLGCRTRVDCGSPSFRGQRSRSRDRFNRPVPKRNRRNSSDDKTIQGADGGDISKNSFDVTTVLVEDLICTPGRESRPSKLVFIMRGLPGSGKTYVTKLIKDKEVEMGGDAPRILSLDDYFMTEVEKEVVDEETGRKTKTKVLEYEYESCAEPHYRGSLLKAFKKTISDGFFSFVIVDSVNEKTKDYEEMWSFAKQKGFQIYVAEMDDDVAICTKRNIHKRTEKEISDLAKVWEKTPNHYLRLDVRSFLQADAITEVEMEVVSDTDNEKEGDKDKDKDKDQDQDQDKDKDKETEAEKMQESKEDEEEDEPGESAFVKSRWDHFENSEQKLDRLDGLKRRREGFHTTMEDYLQLPDDFDLGSNEPTDGKKKVRWADLEERRQQEKMRAIGFVVGQTDWSRMTDPTFGESALTRTKYI